MFLLFHEWEFDEDSLGLDFAGAIVGDDGVAVAHGDPAVPDLLEFG